MCGFCLGIRLCSFFLDRYGERNGGYTRIFHTSPRRGDNTQMAIIELV